ncbi:uncharacterized protein V1516DRAFT_670404 [Lipomyces oligophaga]|uniref:uncharacterized protein n=1 Tax=Lipomyces oligophaga TaxID=45792 RepID=UPI0034CE2AB0
MESDLESNEIRDEEVATQSAMAFCADFLLIVITIFFPPVGVFIIGGCSLDLLINIALTALGFLPGHIHAFYLEYIYFQRRDYGNIAEPAPGVYSDTINTGGRNGYGAIVVEETVITTTSAAS